MRKKAALTLLRLYRKHPTVLPVADWAERIISLMDDRDPVSRNRSLSKSLRLPDGLLSIPQGVALCVTNLVSAMAQDNLDDFAMCYQKAIERLTRVSVIGGIRFLFRY